MSNKEKEITFHYNGFKIKMKFNKDYEKTKKIMKQKLYFQDKELNKFTLNYLDEEDLENMVQDDDEFEEAFSSDNITEWMLAPKETDEENENKDNKLKNLYEQLEKVKENYKKKIKDMQNDVTEKVNKIKEELISKTTKIVNEKLSIINKNYEKKLKSLEELNKVLNEKNKTTLEEMQIAHESSLQKIISDISDLTEKKMEKQLDDYNKKFTETLDSQIKSSTIKLDNERKELNNKIDELTQKQNNMIETLDNSKTCFRNLYNSIIIKKD